MSRSSFQNASKFANFPLSFLLSSPNDCYHANEDAVQRGMVDLCDSLTQLYQQKLIQQQQQKEQGKKAPKEKLYEEV